MDTLELILIAVVLSVDSFATSVALGISRSGFTPTQTLRLSGTFSIAHIVMLSAGYGLGVVILEYIEEVDHWIAFSLLFIIGMKFVYDGIKNNASEEETCLCDPTKGKILVGLAVATSIDALVLDGTLATLGTNLLLAFLLVGISVFITTLIGTRTHRLVSRRIAKYADVVGGFVLIGLGTKVLLEHLL